MTETPRVVLQEGVPVRVEPSLAVDIFIPPAADGPQPAVLLLHGGAWMLGDRSQLRGYGFLVGREGFVVVTGEYRLSRAAEWPAQLDDVTATFDWMVAESQSLGIDPNRIGLAGASSGGHLALLLAATRSKARSPGPSPAAVVSLYGITDLGDAPALKEGVAALLGGFDEERARQASPAHHISPRHPPTLLLHSNQDEIVPCHQSVEYYRRLRDEGVAAELGMFDGVPHAFDADPRLGRQVASTMASFLHRHLPPPTVTSPREIP